MAKEREGIEELGNWGIEINRIPSIPKFAIKRSVFVAELLQKNEI